MSLPDFTNSAKTQWRTTAIVAPVNTLWNGAIPHNRQYITLASHIGSPDDRRFELPQLKHCGVLSSYRQAIVVENDAVIHRANCKAVLGYPDKPRLEFGDVHQVFDRLLDEVDFKPALVNLDYMCCGKKAWNDSTSTILAGINCARPELSCTVVVNVVQRGRRDMSHYCSFDAPIKHMGWDIVSAFSSKGAGTNTVMHTKILHKTPLLTRASKLGSFQAAR